MRYYTKFDITLNRTLFTIIGLLVGSLYGLSLSILLDRGESAKLSNSRIKQSTIRVIYYEPNSK